jgi:hypothetical protein
LGRKKQSDSGVLGMLLVVLGLCYLLAITVIPFVLLYGTLFSIVASLKLRNKVNGQFSDFWLTDAEKMQFKSVSKKLLNAIENIQAAEEVGEKEGLVHNKDGTFDLRSNRGKQVQSTIYANRRQKYSCTPEYEYLKELPKSRWHDFRKTYSMLCAFLFSTVAWVMSSAIVFKKDYNDVLYGYGGVLRLPIDTIWSAFSSTERQPIIAGFSSVLPIAAGSSILVYLIAFYISRFFAPHISPVPPEVNMQNIDDY